jgi:chromosome segregation ATPase
VAGKLHKKYIGKTLELNTAKLEEIAEALNTPPQPRVTDKVTHRVDNLVTHEMAGDTEADRLTALEQQVQALQESLETLRSIVLGKHEDLSSSGELSEPDEALGGQLPIDLDNLRVDNEYLKKKLAEKRDTIDCLNWGTEALNEQLAKLQVENQRLENDLGNLQAELAKQKDDYAAQLAISRQFYQEAQELRSQIEKLKTENEALRNTPLVVEFELPEASVLLNRLKAKRKKATASLADVEAILEILEG